MHQHVCCNYMYISYPLFFCLLYVFYPFVQYWSSWVSYCKAFFVHRAKTLFHGTGVIISDSGKHHLVLFLGTNNFVAGYVRNKITSLVSEIEKLSVIAITQPHAAFANFTHIFFYIVGFILPGLLQGPWSFFTSLMRF